MRREIAVAVGISEQYIYQCLTGRRNMTPSLAVRVEQESGGAITRQQLRRDWREVWPELAAREDARARRKARQKPPAQGVVDVTLGDTLVFGQPQAQEAKL